MAFDLPSSIAPQLIALRESFDPPDYRAELKRLALDLFELHLSEAAFDANVLGMAHLGRFDLVRRSIQTDGLGMIRSDRQASATRYLYRAWKQSETQGRGLHFLRTYMQLLYPNEWEVFQLWQEKDQPYPQGATRHPRGDRTRFFLTSRVDILIPARATNVEQLPAMAPIVASTLPARIVPRFAVFERVNIHAKTGADIGLIGRAVNKTPRAQMYVNAPLRATGFGVIRQL